MKIWIKRLIILLLLIILSFLSGFGGGLWYIKTYPNTDRDAILASAISKLDEKIDDHIHSYLSANNTSLISTLAKQISQQEEFQGPKGDPGTPGSTGELGIAGAKGDKGDSGTTGAAGSSTGGSSGSLITQENDVTVSLSATTLDFLGSDFALTDSPTGETNIALDYANSGLTRTNQSESISALWTFGAGATITTGQAFTLNGDAITDLTGSGLSISLGALTISGLSGSNFTADSLDFTEFQDQLDLDASTDILADNAEVLSITNTGTGNSFLVNDSASDTSPFVINPAGNVGIGTTAPATAFQVGNTAEKKFFFDSTLGQAAIGQAPPGGVAGALLYINAATSDSNVSFGINVGPRYEASGNEATGIRISQTLAPGVIKANGAGLVVEVPTIGAGAGFGSAGYYSGLFRGSHGTTGIAHATTLGLETSADTTLWIGIDTNGTTPASGIYFGASKDTTLYRSAASQITTDGKMRISGALGVIGTPNATAALSIGTSTGIPSSGGISRVLYNLPTIPSTTTSQADIYSSAPLTAASAFTLSTLNHINISDVSIGSGSTVTNQYGIKIAPLANAGSNYGIAVGAASTQTLWLSNTTDSTAASAGIAFGLSRDTNLYRSAANVLTTDDAFTSGGTITQGTFNTANSERLCWDSAGASEITDCTGTPGDYAEYYGTSDPSIEAGDVVMIDSSRPAEEIEKEGEKGSKAYVVKSSQSYQQSVIGIVSTDPNEVIGENFTPDENPRPVALNGRVPVKVTTENGAIVAGDFLTSSSTSGVAMKATRPGQIIGKALESFSQDRVGKILIYVNTTFADPQKALAQFSIDSNGNLVIPSSSIISNEERNPTTDEVSRNARNDKEISELKSSILNLDSKVASLEASLSLLSANPYPPSLLTPNGNSSAQLGLAAAAFDAEDLSINNATISGTLDVAGRTVLADLGITGVINAGLLTINGLDEKGNAAINTTSGPLKLQSDGFNGIDILNGKIVIEPNGNIKVDGEITAKKVNIDVGEVAAASLGEGVLKEGQTSVTVETSAVTNKSKIFITPRTKTSQPLAVTTQSAGESFKVESAAAVAGDVKFNWWIVN